MCFFFSALLLAIHFQKVCLAQFQCQDPYQWVRSYSAIYNIDYSCGLAFCIKRFHAYLKLFMFAFIIVFIKLNVAFSYCIVHFLDIVPFLRTKVKQSHFPGGCIYAGLVSIHSVSLVSRPIRYDTFLTMAIAQKHTFNKHITPKYIPISWNVPHNMLSIHETLKNILRKPFYRSYRV